MYNYDWIGHLRLTMTQLTKKGNANVETFKNNIHCWVKPRSSHQRGVLQNRGSTLMLISFRKYLWRSPVFWNVTSCKHATLPKINSFTCICHIFLLRVYNTYIAEDLFHNISQWLGSQSFRPRILGFLFLGSQFLGSQSLS